MALVKFMIIATVLLGFTDILLSNYLLAMISFFAAIGFTLVLFSGDKDRHSHQ